jgi:hypothetical protein
MTTAPSLAMTIAPTLAETSAPTARATCGDNGHTNAGTPVTNEACNAWCQGQNKHQGTGCVYNPDNGDEFCEGASCSTDTDMTHCCKPDGNTLTNKIVTITGAVLHLTGVSEAFMNTENAQADFKKAVRKFKWSRQILSEI